MELQEYLLVIVRLEMGLLELDRGIKPYKKEIKYRQHKAEINAKWGKNDNERKILRAETLEEYDPSIEGIPGATYPDLVEYVELIDVERRKIEIQLEMLRSEFKIAFLTNERAIASGDHNPAYIESSIEELKLEVEKIETQKQRDAILERIEAPRQTSNASETASNGKSWKNWKSS